MSMYARAVQQLPEGKDWLYEVKFDGYRCLVGRDSSGVTLWSRRGNRFTERSGAWLKYKVNKAQAFVIGGYPPDNP